MQKVIEALESRIAPAAVITYTEADGDLVTIKTSAKISDEAFADLAVFDLDGNLSQLTLDDPIFRKTDLTVTVTQAGEGNGLASIGDIDANVDLRNVVIAGDLRSIEVGDWNAGTQALSKLQVQNLGGNDDSSYFRGNVNSIKITGNLTGNLYSGEEGGDVDFKNITVGGSIIGVEGAVPDIEARRIGSFVVGGNMEAEVEARYIGSVRIGGNLQGVDGRDSSGTIDADFIKSVRIDGSIIGADAYGSGGIWAEHLGGVTVGGNVTGGDGEWSGFVDVDDYLGKALIKGNIEGGAGYRSGQIDGEEIGSVYVGGNLAGGLGEESGFIGSDEGGSISRVVIAGSIIGGGELQDVIIDQVVVGQEIVGGSGSGQVGAEFIASIRVGGNLQGGLTGGSGAIFADGIGSVYIGGSILGGAGEYSGTVGADGINSIRIVADVIGGEGSNSGSIFGDYGIESVKIGGNLIGEASGSGSIGSVEGSIEAITIGGSLSNTGDGITGIYAAGYIGRVAIGGDVTGDEYGTLGIRAGAAYSSVLSIGSVTIKGNATNLLIEAGVGTEFNYSETPEPEIVTIVNADATIGSVSIGGNFTTSSIAASVLAGTDGIYGTSDDILPDSDNGPAKVSRIASVAIGGSVAGTVGGTDSYGIIAQHIVSAKIGGTKQLLTVGASNDTVAKPLGSTGDVSLFEIPSTLLV